MIAQPEIFSNAKPKRPVVAASLNRSGLVSTEIIWFILWVTSVFEFPWCSSDGRLFSSVTFYFSFISATELWCTKPGARKDRSTQTSPCILITLAVWDWPWPRLQALRLGSACACPSSPTAQRFTLQGRRKSTHENFNDCRGLEEDGRDSAFCRV